MGTIVVLIVVFLMLIFGEYLSRAKGVHSELTRKITHILVGTFVAFWPFFLSWRNIQFLSLAFLVVVFLSIRLNIFRSIHAVKRGASGEIWFAIVIGLLAFISTDEWVFAAGMLFLALADGFSAIIGLAYGGNNTYKVFGHIKSVAGSLAFFVTAALITLGYFAFSGAQPSSAVVWLPVVATVAENLSVNGTDNIVLPLLTVLVLSSV